MSDQSSKGGVRVEQRLAHDTRHAVRAAKILYSPPGVVLRGPIYMVFLVVFGALVYSVFAKKDILVVAPLKLERKIHTVEALGGGLITEILANEDTIVRVGDPLLVVQEKFRAAMSPEQEALQARVEELEKQRRDVERDYEFQISQRRRDYLDASGQKEIRSSGLTSRMLQTQQQIATVERGKRQIEEQSRIRASDFRSRIQQIDQQIATAERSQRQVGEQSRTRASALRGRILQTEQQITTARRNQRRIVDQSRTRASALEGRILQTEQQIATVRRSTARFAEEVDDSRRDYDEKKELYEQRDITRPELEAADDRVKNLEKSVADSQSQEIQLELTKSQLQEEFDQVSIGQDKSLADSQSQAVQLGLTKSQLQEEHDQVDIERQKAIADAQAQIVQLSLNLAQLREEYQHVDAERDKAIADASAQVVQFKLSLEQSQREFKQLSDQQLLTTIQENIRKLEDNMERDIRELDDDIRSLKARIAEADTLVPGVRYGDRMVNYKSILDGLVTRIHVSKGNVIGAGNDLVTMVSSMAPLEAVAYVQNQDIGQLRRGQPVKIKYFAYPFQEWGIQLGTISEISTKPSGEAGRESMYIIRVALDTEVIKKKRRRPRKLEMGLEGMAEVKTGEKRLISIVFSPFARFFQEPGGEGDGGDGDGGGDDGAGGSGDGEA
ncbi:MAG: HlyD family efflux transporter periplasmic adaptor subunit [Alphaproteobacteria bacterium]|nr:HlyD family efflux transporter periplasmic adaptor subunit [Alphaproteobacteria bacterium]